MGWSEYRDNYIREQEKADVWQDFHGKFMELASEEEKIERAAPKDRLLRAYCTYQEHVEGWEEESLASAWHRPRSAPALRGRRLWCNAGKCISWHGFGLFHRGQIFVNRRWTVFPARGHRRPVGRSPHP